MMNGLRLVWIISSHYNKDERMVPLMERIAWELAERVKRVVNVRVLFRYCILRLIPADLGSVLRPYPIPNSLPPT